MTEITPELVESRKRGHYIVPNTSHWADWHDDDAIRHHGIFVGDASTKTIVAELKRVLGEYEGVWGILKDEERTGDDYADAFQACKLMSVMYENGYFHNPGK